MSEQVQKKYFRLYFTIPANTVLETEDMRERAFIDDQFVDFSHTYHCENIEKAIEDCMLDYHISFKSDIYDWMIESEYRDPELES